MESTTKIKMIIEKEFDISLKITRYGSYYGYLDGLKVRVSNHSPNNTRTDADIFVEVDDDGEFEIQDAGYDFSNIIAKFEKYIETKKEEAPKKELARIHRKWAKEAKLKIRIEKRAKLEARNKRKVSKKGVRAMKNLIKKHNVEVDLENSERIIKLQVVRILTDMKISI